MTGGHGFDGDREPPPAGVPFYRGCLFGLIALAFVVLFVVLAVRVAG